MSIVHLNYKTSEIGSKAQQKKEQLIIKNTYDSEYLWLEEKYRIKDNLMKV